MIILSKLKVNCFKYHINPDNSKSDSLTSYDNQNSMEYYSISYFGLYDTDKSKNNIKILCRNNGLNIQFNFLK